jgi:hypothetical protein
MGRHWKRDYFGPLTPEVSEKKILSLDTETKERFLPWEWEETTKHSGFLIAVIYDGDKFYEFGSQDEVIAFLKRPKWAGYQVWCCNLEYDLNAVFQGKPNEELFRNYFGGILKGATLVLEDRKIPAKGKRGDLGGTDQSRRLLHFCDTLNQWKASVKTMGEMIGLEKLEMPPEALPGREMFTYCARDAEIVWKFVTMMQEKYNEMGGELKSSIASTSMDLWRRAYFREEHGFKRVPRAFLEFFRRGYFGGRTENFVVGRFGDVPDRISGPSSPIFCADVNSMYPSVMRNTKIPILREPHCSKSAGCIEYEGMTRCVVRAKEQEYPVLPYRNAVSRLTSKLYFPVGEWEGVFTNLELRYALDHGVEIVKILEGIYFKNSDFVFRDYIDDIYNRRLEYKAAGDEVGQYTMKILGNSLYGKTSQWGEVFTVAPKWVLRMKGEKGYEKYGMYAARRQEGNPALYTNFVWAAYVTSGARCILHSHLVGLHALYCDTDSVFSFKRVDKTKDLGALSYDGQSPYIEILGPKTYKMEGKTRMKGIPGEAFGADMRLTEDGYEEFTFNPIKSMDRLPREVFFTEVSRFRSAIRQGILPNSWGIGEKKIKLLPEDRKRFFYPDGTSRPLSIQEIENLRPAWAGVEELPFFEVEGIVKAKRLKEMRA